MDRRIGPERAGLLCRFLAEIRASDSLAECPFFRNGHSDAEHRKEIVIDLGLELRLRLRCNTLQPPLRADGGIDWKRLERVMIFRIEWPDA